MATHSTICAWRIPMNRGAWQATVHGVTKSQTWLSNSTASIYSLLGLYKTWKIPWLMRCGLFHLWSQIEQAKHHGTRLPALGTLGSEHSRLFTLPWASQRLFTYLCFGSRVYTPRFLSYKTFLSQITVTMQNLKSHFRKLRNNFLICASVLL